MSRRLDSPFGKDAPGFLEATDACAFCPNLCLHACPVATASGRTSEAPWALMTLTRWVATGDSAATPDVRRALGACTGCGACTAACLHHVPVAATLQHARAVLHRTLGPAAPGQAPTIKSESSTGPIPTGASGIARWHSGDTTAFTAVAKAAASRWQGRSRLVFEDHADLVCVRDLFPTVGAAVGASLVLSAVDALSSSPPIPAGVVGYLPPCTTMSRLTPTSPVDHGSYAATLETWLGHAPATLRWDIAGTCCGAAEPFRTQNPETARLMAERIVQNARDRGIDVLVVLSAPCAAHLRDVALAVPAGQRPLSIVLPGGDSRVELPR